MATEQNDEQQNTVCLTRKEHFSAAHRLMNREFTEQQNRELFGKCFNIHGHNYILKVTVKGTVNRTSGMLFNITDFKKIIQDEVLVQLDHRFIDSDVDYFASNSIPSTCENLAIWVWHQIERKLPTNVRMYCVKLRETENNYVEFYG